MQKQNLSVLYTDA